MKSIGWVGLIAMLTVIWSCAGKDLTGYTAQYKNALAQQQYAQALIYSAHLDMETLTELANELLNKLGKTRACEELLQAKDRSYKELTSFRDAGKVTITKEAAAAHKRLANVEFQYCQ